MEIWLYAVLNGSCKIYVTHNFVIANVYDNYMESELYQCIIISRINLHTAARCKQLVTAAIILGSNAHLSFKQGPVKDIYMECKTISVSIVFLTTTLAN